MYNSNIYRVATLAILSVLSSTPVQAWHPFRLEHYQPDSYWVPSPDQVAQHVFSLRGRTGNPRSAGYLQALTRGSEVQGVYGITELNTTNSGLVFATDIKVGPKTYEVVVDTGSSDTWLARKGFECATPGSEDILSEAACLFGPLYTPSSTFKPIADENFHVDYSDGESLSGTFGRERVTLAGITVDNQQIALVDFAAWNGDGVTSGLLGLAFAANTKAYSGTNAQKDTPATQKPYNPLFTNMYTEGHVAPLFSIALDRKQGGLLAIGGLPPVSCNPVFASSPFQILNTAPAAGANANSSSQYTLYTITTNGFDYENSAPSQWSYDNYPNPFEAPSNPAEVQMIVDSGTTTIYLPSGTADAVNALFNPKPLYTSDAGYYIVSCTARPPQFGVKIGFETFYINPADMIINLGGQCISGVASTGPGGTSILGHTFLKNVLAVFDVGAQMMRFAAREY